MTSHHKVPTIKHMSFISVRSRRNDHRPEPSPGVLGGECKRECSSTPAGGSARFWAHMGRRISALPLRRLRPHPGSGHCLPGGDVPRSAAHPGTLELGEHGGPSSMPNPLRARRALPEHAGKSVFSAGGLLRFTEGRSHLQSGEK